MKQDILKLKAAISVVDNSILHGERCNCVEPFLICPPTGYCYKCDKLRKIEKPHVIYILESFSHRDLEKQLITKYGTLFPNTTRKTAAKELGWPESTFIGKLKEYGLLDYWPKGKKGKAP